MKTRRFLGVLALRVSGRCSEAWLRRNLSHRTLGTLTGVGAAAVACGWRQPALAQGGGARPPTILRHTRAATSGPDRVNDTMSGVLVVLCMLRRCSFCLSVAASRDLAVVGGCLWPGQRCVTQGTAPQERPPGLRVDRGPASQARVAAAHGRVRSPGVWRQSCRVPGNDGVAGVTRMFGAGHGMGMGPGAVTDPRQIPRPTLASCAAFAWQARRCCCGCWRVLRCELLCVAGCWG